MASRLVTIFGVALVVSGLSPPDPMAGFPADARAVQSTAGGVVHLAAGALGFLSLAGAALSLGRWYRRHQSSRMAAYSLLTSTLVGAGFLIGATAGAAPDGVASLWVGVVAAWAWLAAASMSLYRMIPHPDGARRGALTR